MSKWMIKNIKSDFNQLARELSIDQLTAKLLINRGIENKDIGYKYINSSIEHLYDPLLMKDMKKGAKIIIDNILNSKKILIVGDYDVDGVMSTYILYSSLESIGANVKYHIPDRISEGYGINESIIIKAKEDKVDLIITCDNGISACEQVKLAKSFGMQIVITDHHEIPFVENKNGGKIHIIPEADAVIDSKQLDCKYPFKQLCGAGVAFKLIKTLFKLLNNNSDINKYLEYVAIATVCDVVDLIDENRIFVKKGLELLNNTNNIGIKALIDKTGLKNKNINCYSIGFVIGPCINASGRLLLAKLSMDLLLSKDIEKAKEIAQQLYNINKERQDLTNAGVEYAINQIDRLNIKKNKVFVIYLPEVHESIAGIIAGRIRERYNVPTIILTRTKDIVKGSGRSIEKYNMFEELFKVKELLVNFGGHPMAAGLSLQEENIDRLNNLLNDKCKLTTKDLIPKVLIDVQLPFRKVTLKLIEEFKFLEPFGKGNSKPIFAEKKIKFIKANILGSKRNVLKFKLQSNEGIYMEGIYFNNIETFIKDVSNNFGEKQWNNLLEGKNNSIMLDLVFNPNVNEYMGKRTLQIVIQNYRVSI